MTTSLPARAELRVISLRDRRKAIIVLLCSYLAAAVLWHFGASRQLLALKLASLPVLLLSIVAYAMLFFRTGYWTWGSGLEADLDERQLHVRSRAYMAAYSIFVPAVFVAMLYYHIASDAGLWLPDRQFDWEWVFWGVLLLGMNLPSLVLAWIDRPIAGDEN